MKNKAKARYGNWISTNLMILVCNCLLLFLIVLLCLIVLTRGWLWIALVSVPTACILFLTAYLYLLRRAFSFEGGGMMGVIHQFLVDHLNWDGKGKLLEVGCGSAALTIRCAKKFKDAKCYGIDYWGAIWNYGQALCESNAKVEGVDERCFFSKGDANHLAFEDEIFDAVVSNFVYHEVRNNPDKYSLIRETLRVLKKGGSFSLLDLFGQKSIYGDFPAFVETLKREGITKIHYLAYSEKRMPLPRWMKIPGILSGVGLIYGIK